MRVRKQLARLISDSKLEQQRQRNQRWQHQCWQPFSDWEKDLKKGRNQVIETTLSKISPLEPSLMRC